MELWTGAGSFSQAPKVVETMGGGERILAEASFHFGETIGEHIFDNHVCILLKDQTGMDVCFPESIAMGFSAKHMVFLHTGPA